MDYTVKVILLVIVFSLISGGAGYYLGSLSKSTSKVTQPITTPAAKASPAATPSAGFNPFVGATGSATTNPFESSYQNPFSNVKGAATGYVNPFDELLKKPTGTYNYLPNLR